MRLLIQSPHAWQGVWQRPHHLAREFARAGHSVQYVQTRYVRWWLRERGRFRQARSERTEEGIDVRSVTLMNGERLGVVRSRNLRALARELTVPSSNTPRVLWLYNPHEAGLADLVPHEILVYDIMDEYRGFPWSPPRIEEEEASLLARADHVFAGTWALYEAKRALAEGRITCELSGVDAAFFARPKSSLAPPDELSALKLEFKRIIGYAGVIDLRMDQKFIAEAARVHPEWCWVLLGPVRCDIAGLRHLANVRLLGERPYADLPRYYHAFDCAVIPFVENEVTRHINPTKILEYAAAGLPVVSRALPDAVRFYSDGAWLYRTTTEALQMIEMVLSEGDSALDAIKARKVACAGEWPRERSWSAIAARMIRAIAPDHASAMAASPTLK